MRYLPLLALTLFLLLLLRSKSTAQQPQPVERFTVSERQNSPVGAIRVIHDNVSDRDFLFVYSGAGFGTSTALALIPEEQKP